MHTYLILLHNHPIKLDYVWVFELDHHRGLLQQFDFHQVRGLWNARFDCHLEEHSDRVLPDPSVHPTEVSLAQRLGDPEKEGQTSIDPACHSFSAALYT